MNANFITYSSTMRSLNTFGFQRAQVLNRSVYYSRISRRNEFGMSPNNEVTFVILVFCTTSHLDDVSVTIELKTLTLADGCCLKNVYSMILIIGRKLI